MNKSNKPNKPKIVKKLKFIHITKTAGTAIEELGNANNIKWGRFDPDIKLLTEHLSYIQDGAFWHVPTIYYDLEILKKIKKTFDFFLIVRDPYERVISEFYCKWGGFQSKNFGHKYNIKITESSSHEQINKWIGIRLSHLSQQLEKKKYLANGHWVPQFLYMFDIAGKKIVKKNNIIHLENIKNELNKLFSRYKLNINYSQAPLININKKSFGVKNLSKANINLINQIYKNDFGLFGYQMI